MSLLSTIEIDASEALTIIQSTLPLIEKVAPMGAAAGPVGLGVSAAAALLPLLQKIPTGLISAEEQAALASRIAAYQTGVPFSGPQWQPRADE